MEYGRLRLSCFWENAGPAPVWFGDIAPVSYFRPDHGALLARHPFPEKVEAAYQAVMPNDAPMFSSRRANYPDHPWDGFLCETLEESAATWVSRYPELASEGKGIDPSYVAWYARMLDATAPVGLIAAAKYWEEPPGYMYVDWGPEGIDRIDLPPPGQAELMPLSAPASAKRWWKFW